MGRISWTMVGRVLAGLVFLLSLPGTGWSEDRVAVKAPIANLRDGAGTKFKVLWQVEQYHPFQVIKKEKDWSEVKDFEGDTAWVHDSLLDKTRTVITTKSDCNVRSGPDTDAPVVLKVEKGVPFKVLQEKDNWIQVEHADGEQGWIYKTLVW